MFTADAPSLLAIPFHTDSRGIFSKPLTEELGPQLDFTVSELFWTTSSAGAIRGMHFQLPPMHVKKLVWVTSGSVLDVLVDLRDGTRFGTVTSFALDAQCGNSLWIPAGFAHGFQALEDNSIINYAVDAPYSRELDTGIRWDSIDFDWPLPFGEISARDRQLVPIDDFDRSLWAEPWRSR